MSGACALLLGLAAAVPQSVPVPAEIGSAAKSCAGAVSVAGVKPAGLIKAGWAQQSTSAENGAISYAKPGLAMTITTAALPGVNMCAIRARTAGDDQFAAITRAVGKSLHAKDAMQVYNSLAAKRTGEAFFDTSTHSVTLSARTVDGGPGVQISLVAKR